MNQKPDVTTVQVLFTLSVLASFLLIPTYLFHLHAFYDLLKPTELSVGRAKNSFLSNFAHNGEPRATDTDILIHVLWIALSGKYKKLNNEEINDCAVIIRSTFYPALVSIGFAFYFAFTRYI